MKNIRMTLNSLFLIKFQMLFVRPINTFDKEQISMSQYCYCYQCEKNVYATNDFKCPICHEDYLEIDDNPPPPPPSTNQQGNSRTFQFSDLFNPMQILNNLFPPGNNQQNQANMYNFMGSFRNLFQNVARRLPNSRANPNVHSTITLNNVTIIQNPDGTFTTHVSNNNTGNTPGNTNINATMNPATNPTMNNGNAQFQFPNIFGPTGFNFNDFFIGTEEQLSALAERLFRMNQQSLGTPPTDEHYLANLQPEKYESGVCVEDVCSVCLDQLEEGADVIVLPCKHGFHPDCISPWLKMHSECPSCRHRLPEQQ
ncbi:hypothetical protein TRFO_32434 [Tritrichomonas foetus]|uniref:RING-type domain-containing protein n=1 Tax=Tritrichomonas foetus TaxID=1144522 RepID=A0A1J4JNQ0_9EUKA|nr:hypothetical protein TRFO_32434 [Tritrichomonas foetus]|eukprot:OHT00753.1 hypothetical protein TRFO_32434 [Tritrichomonas foetus]